MDHQLDAVVATRLRQRRVLAFDLRQLRRQWMAAGGAEEVLLAEVDADQSDARCAKVARELHRDERRVVRIVQRVDVGTLDAAAPTEAKAHHARLRKLEVRQLREHRLRLRALDVQVALARELPALVDDDQVVGREAPPDVVDANRQPALGLLEQAQRFAATAHDDAGAAMALAVLREALGATRHRLVRAAFMLPAPRRHGALRPPSQPLMASSSAT